MRHSLRYYEQFGGDRIVPDISLEVEVVRQAILADKWDLVPEQAVEFPNAVHHIQVVLTQRGGQAVYTPEWSPAWIAHYEIGEHDQDGFFDLRLQFYPTVTSRAWPHELPGLTMFAALRAERRPPFQNGWKGVPRERFWHPWWYFVPARSKPSGLELRADGPMAGPLVVNSPVVPTCEWHAVAPHVQLVVPGSLATP